MNAGDTTQTQVQQGLDAVQKVTAFWQELVQAQLGQFETKVETNLKQVETNLKRFDEFAKAQLTRAQSQLEHGSQLMASALTWASELQASALQTTLGFVEKASQLAGRKAGAARGEGATAAA